MKTPIAFSALLFLGVSSASAQKLEDFKPGRTVSGERVDFDDLAGRVVAIEYWGTH